MESLSISFLYELFLQCTVVSTDTRNCTEGSLFVALKGDKFNGNLFVEQALRAGARYALVDEPVPVQSSQVIRVENTLYALQQLAHYHRTQLGTRVIGITGTNGKTTTKELMNCVLSEKYKVLATQGNLNNHIGVPLTLLKLRSDHELAIIEMGASHPGDIRELTEIADPDYGLITNVGRGHLEGFGSFEGVVRTKRELYDFLRPRHSVVFVDASNSYLTERIEGLNPVYYGVVPECRAGYPLFISGRSTDSSMFLSFEWKEKGELLPHAVDTQLIGEYNLSNALAAVAVGRYFEVDPQAISRALRDYVPSNNRSQLKVTSRNQLIVDAYNANPTSMEAALLNFARMKAPRKAVILGDMKELGPASAEAHLEILKRVAICGFEWSVFVGNEFRSASLSAALSQFNPEQTRTMEFYQDTEALLDTLRTKEKIQGYLILIKGSNSMTLFRLTEEL